MTNSIQIFNSAEFGDIRTIQEGEKVLFCGKDVAAALGYTNSRKALADHCKGVTKRYTPTDGGEQEMSFIPEGDLYRLICNSKLPSAEKFERWVFDEILPTIRKTGAYSKLPDFTNPAIAARAWADEVEQKLALAAKIEKDKHKVAFADAVSVSDTDILMRDMAKILRQNGFLLGGKRLFAIFRERGFLMRTKNEWNRPTQRAMELGLFRVQERVVFNRVGNPFQTVFTTYVTPKGQIYFVNAFKNGALTVDDNAKENGGE